MSRLEAGKAEPHREPIDLAEVLDAAREGARRPRPGAARDRPRSADGRRRRRPARAGLRQPARERDPLRRRAAGLGALAAGRRQDRRPRRRPGARASRESEWQRIFEPFQRGATTPRPAPASAWRSPRGSSRPTAARSRSSRCRDRGRASSSPSRCARMAADERGDRGSWSATTSRRSSAPCG